MRQCWNMWFYGSYSRRNDGYITHAFEETESGHVPDKTLCGRRLRGNPNWESGMVLIPQESMPGCAICHAQVERSVVVPVLSQFRNRNRK